MTVKELASKLNKLFAEGKGHYSIYFAIDEASLPVASIREEYLAKQAVIKLDWRGK